MTMPAELVDVVIGVDTHKHTHTAAVVIAATGATPENVTVDTDLDGYAISVAMADRYSGLQAWSIEGTGGYGAGLARYLAERDELVIELDRPNRPARIIPALLVGTQGPAVATRSVAEVIVDPLRHFDELRVAFDHHPPGIEPDPAHIRAQGLEQLRDSAAAVASNRAARSGPMSASSRLGSSAWTSTSCSINRPRRRRRSSPRQCGPRRRPVLDVGSRGLRPWSRRASARILS